MTTLRGRERASFPVTLTTSVRTRRLSRAVPHAASSRPSGGVGVGVVWKRAQTEQRETELPSLRGHLPVPGIPWRLPVLPTTPARPHSRRYNLVD